MREIRILKELKHPNIVNLIEVFRWKGKIFLVFEYVPHTLLEELENNAGGLSEREVKKYMWQLVRGTEFVHSHNVVHRDIKPENLLISKHGAMKICDFGFARFLSGPDSLYTDYVSTRWYRAPELLVGDANYAQGVDIWAIGCLLAELTTGQPLFPGESDLKTLQLIMNTIGGSLTDKQRKTLQDNPIFDGMEPLKVIGGGTVTTEPLLAQKVGKMSREGIEFLKVCLQIDPSKRLTCSELLRHKYFDGLIEEFQKELDEIMQKDIAEFQMRTKLNCIEGSISNAAIAQPSLPMPISPIEVTTVKQVHCAETSRKSSESDENEENDNLSQYNEENNNSENSMGEDGIAPVPVRSIPQKVSKVTLTFIKPRNERDHNNSNIDLNTSLTKKSTKVPPGGGAGPSTMILRDLNNPSLLSKKSFTDFQNPPSFLRSEALPQLKGKSLSQNAQNNQSSTNQNQPKVSRLVALPQITEVKAGTEKSYLKGAGQQKIEKNLETSFELRGIGGLDENSNPGITGTKINKKTSMFPTIQGQYNVIYVTYTIKNRKKIKEIHIILK